MAKWHTVWVWLIFLRKVAMAQSENKSPIVVYFHGGNKTQFFQNPLGPLQSFDLAASKLFASEPQPRLACVSEQENCYSSHLEYYGSSNCYMLLRQGPCPEGYVVALDQAEVLQGNVVPTCVNVTSDCPPGQVRLLSDGECHAEKGVKIGENGVNVTTQLNQFGETFETPYELETLEFEPDAETGDGNTVCIMEVNVSDLTTPQFQ